MISDFLYHLDSSQRLIIKLTGTACNISCKYCFEKSKNLDFQEFLSPATLHNSLMQIDCQVGIVLHGGEPLLLGIDSFSKILSVVRKHRNKIRTVFLMTNGTLLNQVWIDLLFKEFKDLNIEMLLVLTVLMR